MLCLFFSFFSFLLIEDFLDLRFDCCPEWSVCSNNIPICRAKKKKRAIGLIGPCSSILPPAYHNCQICTPTKTQVLFYGLDITQPDIPLFVLRTTALCCSLLTFSSATPFHFPPDSKEIRNKKTPFIKHLDVNSFDWFIGPPEWVFVLFSLLYPRV